MTNPTKIKIDTLFETDCERHVVWNVDDYLSILYNEILKEIACGL